MAQLVAGYIFGSTETVTAAKLAALVNSGSVTGITQADLASSQGLVFTGTSAPSDTDQLWIDTNTSPALVKIYNSSLSSWVPATELAVLTNRTGQTGSSGRVLVLDTSNSNSYKYTSTAGDLSFLGIEIAQTANLAKGPVISRALGVLVNLELSASAGTYLRTSTATGKAEPCAAGSQGIFGFLTESGTASATSYVNGVNQASVNQASNYSWTGQHIFSASATFKGQTIISATATIAAGTTFRQNATDVYGQLIPKAWVDFSNGGSINASANVASVSKNGTGDYTINLSRAFTNTNYIVSGMLQNASGGHGFIRLAPVAAPRSASACRIETFKNDGSSVIEVDRTIIQFIGDT